MAKNKREDKNIQRQKIQEIAYTVAILAALMTLFFVEVRIVRGETSFLSSKQFPFEGSNGTLVFSEGGSYERALFENNTWFFDGLLLNGSNHQFEGKSILARSFSRGNLSVSVKNCNVSIDNFDLLMSPDISHPWEGEWLSPGWLNYSISGEGNQTFDLYYPSKAPLPFGVQVYLDGSPGQRGIDWFFSNDSARKITVTKIAKDVNIRYNWLPGSKPYIPPERPNNAAGVLIAISIVAIIASVAAGIIVLSRKRTKKITSTIQE